MKRLLIILAILILAAPAMAADLNKSLTFSWNQTSTDLPNLQGWGLYVMTTSGGSKPAPISITYTGGNGPFTTASAFTVTGNPGETVRRFFVIDAVGKNGARTGFSNEVYYDFVFPFADVTTPMSLTVTVTLNP